METEPSDEAARRLASKRFNERLKLFSSFSSALGIGTIGAGVIIPMTKTPIEIAPITLAWLAGGLILHLVGHGVYAFLRSEG